MREPWQGSLKKRGEGLEGSASRVKRTIRRQVFEESRRVEMWRRDVMCRRAASGPGMLEWLQEALELPEGTRAQARPTPTMEGVSDAFSNRGPRG